MELGQNSVKGTKFKLNVSMTPIDNYHMEDVEWEVVVFTETSHKSITIEKKDAIKVDADNYVICVDSDVRSGALLSPLPL